MHTMVYSYTRIPYPSFLFVEYGKGVIVNDIMNIASDTMTALYASISKMIDRCTERCGWETQIRWCGSGSIRWDINVKESGVYTVAICYATLDDRVSVMIGEGDNTVSRVLEPSDGYFIIDSNDENSNNFQRVILDDILALSGGRTSIDLNVQLERKTAEFRICSIELTPVKAKGSIAARDMQDRECSGWQVYG